MTYVTHTIAVAIGVVAGLSLPPLLDLGEPERPPPVTEGRCQEITPGRYRGFEADGYTWECAWRQRLWGCWLVSTVGWARDRWFCEARRSCQSHQCLEELPP